MTAFEGILSLNLILVYIGYFQLRKLVLEIRKDVDRDIDIEETEQEEVNLWRTKDDFKN